MRSLLLSVVFFALSVVGLQTQSGAPRAFSSAADEAFHFASLTLEDYAALLSGAADTKGNDASTAKLVRYYQHLLADKEKIPKALRDPLKGTVHDCVPYELQPSLFEASMEEVNTAMAHLQDAIRKRKSPLASVGEESPSSCPGQTVGIVRPILRWHFKSPKLHLVPQKKKARNGGNRRATVATSSSSDAGYSYVDSAFVPVYSNVSQWAYTVLGVGALANADLATIPAQNPAPGYDHSINQLWWLEEIVPGNPSAYFYVSLETGWITCAYWSVFPTTSIFAFSTPNEYGLQNETNATAQIPNQYNTAGGFILYPSELPPPAQDVTNILYMFNYSVMPNNGGYELSLVPFKRSSRGIFYVFEDPVPYGYFPMSRYLEYGPQKVPKLNVFQTGQEIDQGRNSSRLTAAGKIFGWGSSTEPNFNIVGNFSGIGLFTLPFHYGNFPTFGINNTNPYTQQQYVHFDGPLCGKYCPGKGTE